MKKKDMSKEQIANLVEPTDVVDIDPATLLDRNHVYGARVDDREYVYHDARDDQDYSKDPLMTEALRAEQSQKMGRKKDWSVGDKMRGFECDRAAKLEKKRQEIDTDIDRQIKNLKKKKYDLKSRVARGESIEYVGKGSGMRPGWKNKADSRKKGPVALKYTFDEDYCEAGYRYALLNASNHQIAEAMGVSVAQLENWKTAIPEFRAALVHGRLDADALVAHALFKSAAGFSHPEEKVVMENGKAKVITISRFYPPNPISIQYWLRCRQKDKWQDGGKNQPTMKNTQFNITIVADNSTEGMPTIQAEQQAGQGIPELEG